MEGKHECTERPPIVQYWHAEEAPDYIADLFETYDDLNPDRRHLVFSRSSAAAFIDEHFDSRRLRAFEACAVPAMQADYFRYCATLALGGAYCDADSRCVASLRSLVPAGGAGRLFQRSDSEVTVNGLYAFGSPGHPFIELALEVATANIERRTSNHVYATTGPLIFTNLCRLRRLGSFDALMEHLAGHRSEWHARVLCEAIGDYGLVNRAFEGVMVSPISENVWIRAPECPLPYKETDEHWTNFKGTIYR
jgi:hypothetical protein